MVEREDFYFTFDATACSRCNAKCCSGESGNIFFSKSEMVEIAKFLDISTERFLLDFCRKEGYRYSIKEIKIGGEYRCIFLSGNMCDIYQVRPQQCRTFPFWERFKNGKNLEELLNECIGVVPKDDVN